MNDKSLSNTRVNFPQTKLDFLTINGVYNFTRQIYPFLQQNPSGCTRPCWRSGRFALKRQKLAMSWWKKAQKCSYLSLPCTWIQNTMRTRRNSIPNVSRIWKASGVALSCRSAKDPGHVWVMEITYIDIIQLIFEIKPHVTCHNWFPNLNFQVNATLFWFWKYCSSKYF